MPSQSTKDKLKKLEKQQLETAKRAQLAKIARRKLIAGKPIVSAKRVALGRTSSIPMVQVRKAVKKKVKKTGGGERKYKIGQIISNKSAVSKKDGARFKIISINPKTIIGKSVMSGRELKISKKNIV